MTDADPCGKKLFGMFGARYVLRLAQDRLCTIYATLKAAPVLDLRYIFVANCDELTDRG
jgi:hypothetical protein